MKTPAFLSFVVVSAALGFPQPLHAEGKGSDKAKQVRVQVEFIDVSHEQLTEMMFGEKPAANDGELRKQAAQLVKDGKASIAETMLCLARSGEKARTESIEEYIYPTEYEPPQVPALVGVTSDTSGASGDGVEAKAPPAKAIQEVPVTGPTPTAFQTRNLGSTMEMQATLSDDNKTVSMKIAPEIVHHVGNEVWAEWKGKQGDAPIQMPKFYVLRLDTSVTLATGQYMLLGAMSPKDKEGFPDFTRKLMVFVKADVVGAGR